MPCSRESRLALRVFHITHPLRYPDDIAIHDRGILTWVYDNYITGKAVRPERVSEYITEEQYADSCSTIVMSKGQGDFDANAFDCQDGLENFRLVCLCWAVAKTEHEHNRAGYIYL